MEIQYARSNSNYNIHYHYDHEIIYITRGKCEMTVNEKKYIAKSGDVILICNLENHRTEVLEEPYERYIVKIKPSELGNTLKSVRLTAMLKKRHESFSHCLKMDSPAFSLLFEKIQREKSEKSEDEFSEELSKMYLKEIMINILRAYEENFPKELNKTDELIILAESYIDKNFSEDIKISELANKFFLNKYYFSHCFKEFSGMSPKQYLTQVRMNNALKLLKSTELTVSEAATSCGFSDVNNFIRLFKKSFGVTPKEYRSR